MQAPASTGSPGDRRSRNPQRAEPLLGSGRSVPNRKRSWRSKGRTILDRRSQRPRETRYDPAYNDTLCPFHLLHLTFATPQGNKMNHTELQNLLAGANILQLGTLLLISSILAPFLTKVNLFSTCLAVLTRIYSILQLIYTAILSPLRKIPGPWYCRWSPVPSIYQRIKGCKAKWVHGLHEK